MATNTPTLDFFKTEVHAFGVEAPVRVAASTQEVIAAIQAMRGLFAGSASLEFEFLLARDKETW